MISVFISYTTKDKDIAIYIYKELVERGAKVFIDFEGLRSGNFWTQLGEEILSRDFFIVLLSPEAAASKWVQREIAWAITVKADEKKIIPLLVRPLSHSDWKNIFPLIPLQYIDFSNWFKEHKEDDATNKLANYLGIPTKRIVSSEPYEEFFELEEGERQEEEEEEPLLSIDEIIRVLERAKELEVNNPSTALFLYKEALSSLNTFVEDKEKPPRP